jgi:methanogenic corrinoid protein MtbC1
METVELFKTYLEHLFAGRRAQARQLIEDAHDRGFGADRLLSLILWPAMEQIDKLYRENHIDRIVEHMAVRINRTIASQLQPVLNHHPKDGRRIVVVCGECDGSELGAQMASDLFEAEGWAVWFVGSGVANDEILKFVGKIEPDLLLVYGSIPPEVPGVRKLIALIREIGICKDMQVMVCGGIYNRAEDLAEEIKADLFARNVREAIQVADENPNRIERSDKPEPGRRRKRKRQTPPAKVRELRQELGVDLTEVSARERRSAALAAAEQNFDLLDSAGRAGDDEQDEDDDEELPVSADIDRAILDDEED